MHWVTLSHVHLDRAAAPWLIERFVDPGATFGFVAWGAEGIPKPGDIEVPAGATPFAIPGVELGLHDEHGTCCAKILRRYGLDHDPGLVAVERVIAAGVRHTFGKPPADDETAEESMLGGALNLLGAGLGLAFDDDEHLAVAFGMYDGLLAHCRMRLLPAEVTDAAPFLPPRKIPYLREHL